MKKIDFFYSAVCIVQHCKMSILIKQLEKELSNPDINLEKIKEYESKLAEEYNYVTEEYRHMFCKLQIARENKQQQLFDKCSHKYTTYSEYHNERYSICDKCGHEK